MLSKKAAVRAVAALCACWTLGTLAQNPISTNFAADPSVHVFNDKYYLYATNDQGNSGTYWDSTDWRLLTSTDLASWREYRT